MGMRQFLVSTAVAGLALPAIAGQPNVLLILTDDHATSALSAYGSQRIRTPNLDKLAQQGMRFDRCYATNAICSPSRAAILTGKYGHKNGVMAFDRFDGSQMHAGAQFQRAGYQTAVLGKWHLVSEPTGFDHWRILPGQGLYIDPVFIDPAGRTRRAGYATDLITDDAIGFLKARNKDKPFFLFVGHKAPHRPWQPDDAHREMFASKKFIEPESFWDDYSGRSRGLTDNKMRVADDLTRGDLKLLPPEALTGQARVDWLAVKPTEVEVVVNDKPTILRGKELASWKYQRYMQDYLACVASVDKNVGRLMNYLDDSGLSSNTIVIYTSDQGFFLGEHGLFDKRYMYEESIRMPLLVRWPGEVAENTVAGEIVTNVDLGATLLELSGQPIPADTQGRSILPLLRGSAPPDWPTSFYYRYSIDGGEHNTAAHCGVRTMTHKLIHYYAQGDWELYDLTTDPMEMNNLFGKPEYEHVTRELQRELSRLQAKYEDAIPGK